MIAPAATRLGDPPEGFDENEARLIAQVGDHGWRTTNVGGAPGYPAFGYTTGFWLTYGRPEIITFDLTPELRHSLFGLMAQDGEEGRLFRSGERVPGLIEGEEVWLMPVGRAKADAFLRSTAWFYRDAAFPCWQLVWGDAAGRFPWQDDFEPGLAGVQPDLSEHGDWGGMAASG